MKKSTLKFFFALCLLVLLNSCATVFSGSRQWVTFDSEPQGAQVSLDGVDLGITPVRYKVKGEFDALLDDGPEVIIDRQGYKPRRDYLEGHINGVCILNLFVFPFWAIDLATGAGIRYNKHNKYVLELDQDELPLNPDILPEPSVKEDKYDKLWRLKELLDEGVITQEEFEREKKKILEE